MLVALRTLLLRGGLAAIIAASACADILPRERIIIEELRKEAENYNLFQMNQGINHDVGEDDWMCKEQQKGRPSTYGHVYVEGSPERFEFYTARFSARLPCGTLPFVLAQPLNACGGSLTNANEAKGAIVVVQRGECEYTDKANAVASAGGAAVVVVNTQGGLLQMPSGKRKTMPTRT